MPTLQEWQQALETQRRIYVDSTQDLANRVNALRATKKFERDGGIPKTAIGSPEFDPPRDILVAPAEFLAALGRITTPQIENLADLSSTWAKIRYIWAIQPSRAGTKMRLSRDAKEIDFHQKGLLSDEMGVGMAYYVMSHYFNATNPVDIDVALRTGNIPNLLPRPSYGTRPDYIFEHPIEGYIIVECKGSQSTDSSSKKQLRRGLEQVPAIHLDGQGLRGYVVGTSLSTNGLKIFILDPPDGKLSRKDDRKKREVNRKQFSEGVQVSQAAALYQFVGRFEKARSLLRQEKRHSLRDEAPPTKRRIDFIQEDYIGQVQDIQYSGEAGNVRIFQGIPDRTYQLIEREIYDPLERRNHELFTRAKNVSDEYKRRNNFSTENAEGAYLVERANNTLRATVIDRDGAVTQIEVR